MESSERRQDPETGQMTEWKGAGGWFEVGLDAENYIDKTLGDRFGIGPFFLMNLTKDRATWAAVFFAGIIEHSDELLEARAELRDDIGFATYGVVEPGRNNPPLGAMVVKSAAALNAASSRHKVFRSMGRSSVMRARQEMGCSC
jgi:hypothetical protein